MAATHVRERRLPLLKYACLKVSLSRVHVPVAVTAVIGNFLGGVLSGRLCGVTLLSLIHSLEPDLHVWALLLDPFERVLVRKDFEVSVAGAERLQPHRRRSCGGFPAGCEVLAASVTVLSVAVCPRNPVGPRLVSPA